MVDEFAKQYLTSNSLVTLKSMSHNDKLLVLASTLLKKAATSAGPHHRVLRLVFSRSPKTAKIMAGEPRKVGSVQRVMLRIASFPCFASHVESSCVFLFLATVA